MVSSLWDVKREQMDACGDASKVQSVWNLLCSINTRIWPNDVLKLEEEASTVELLAIPHLNATVSPFCLWYICVFWAHSRRKTTVTVSLSLLSAGLIDAHATTGSLTDCWMNIPLIDVTDNQTIGLMSQTTHQPPPLSHSISVWAAWCVFTAYKPRESLKTPGLGFISQASWHQQHIDAIGPVRTRDDPPERHLID